MLGSLTLPGIAVLAPDAGFAVIALLSVLIAPCFSPCGRAMTLAGPAPPRHRTCTILASAARRPRLSLLASCPCLLRHAARRSMPTSSLWPSTGWRCRISRPVCCLHVARPAACIGRLLWGMVAEPLPHGAGGRGGSGLRHVGVRGGLRRSPGPAGRWSRSARLHFVFGLTGERLERRVPRGGARLAPRAASPRRPAPCSPPAMPASSRARC